MPLASGRLSRPLRQASLSCWICRTTDLEVVKASDIRGALTSEAFAISNSHYGRTAEIHRCRACGFMQCSYLTEVLGFYEDLQDLDYERSREARAFQEARILQRVQRYRSGGRLLDVGAGAGVLVEEALKRGWAAVGVEPSQWLHDQAAKRGLPVLRGTLPHSDLRGPFHVVTLIDVLEHVPNPVGLLTDVADVLDRDGVTVIATPDVSSFCARVFGWRWWHFRVAHIGYFDLSTLRLALDRAGLQPRGWHRLGWYFKGDYLFARLSRYVPGLATVRRPAFLGRWIIPLNLFDSILVIAGRK
jgi:SAM-dependent methyltransferase